MSTALDALLAPRSIAVVGASRTRGTIGAALFDNLLLHGFQGPVYPVNPGAAVVHSVKAYPSVSAIPDPVDLTEIYTLSLHDALPIWCWPWPTTASPRG